MAAPKGSSFWMRRTKHGRKAIFDKPEVLWKVALEYFNYCDKNPWYRNEAIKSGENAGKIIPIPTQRPYTIEGFCIYAGVGKNYLEQFEKSLTVMAGNIKAAEKQDNYSGIITRIKEIIRTQKFEGATVGAFNANIIARDLGLVDKKDHTTDGESFNKSYYDLLKARRIIKNPELKK